MFYKKLHPFLLALIPLFGFSQEKKQTVYLQVLAGNSFYYKPATATDPLSAGAEINFVAGQVNDSAKWNCFYSFGIGWNESQQTFNVVWPKPKGPTPAVSDLFNTHEFTFSAGGLFNYKLTPKVSLCLPFGFQGSHNYTWIDDPGDLITVYGIKQLRYKIKWDYLARPFHDPGINAMRNKNQYFNYEYFQFYFCAGLQFKFQLSQKASFLLGVKTRTAFYYENIQGESSGELQKMNYAPVKLMPHFALQYKIFK